MNRLIFMVLGLAMLISIPLESISQNETKPSLQINGRIHYDLAFIKNGENAVNGQEFRRMMFTAKGNISERVSYSAQFDLAGAKLGFRDVYIKLGSLPYIGGHLIVGNFAEPTGLDMMTSSKYISFIERAMLTSTQNFRWNSGFQYANHNIIQNRVGLQLAYTFNGDKSVAFIDDAIFEGSNFVGRLYGIAFQNPEKRQLVHLGFNYERRDNPTDSYKLSFRPETHFGSKISYTDSVDLQQDFGFELAATFGPISLQGEYELSNQIIDDENYSISGYYAYASFFVTGEHRPYKNGSFGRVKPKNDFCVLDNKWGALELLARYSVMDFGNAAGLGVFDGDNVAMVHNLTFGFNWYLNKHTRLMYNYNWSDLDTGRSYSANQIRLQVDF